jgi:hypothetical protein
VSAINRADRIAPEKVFLHTAQKIGLN